jgi:tetratricopeptide (TPR) repeat protein
MRQRTTAEGVAPGALSKLLGELADLSDDARGEAWADWLEPGVVIGRFELVAEIGRGGLGVVWEARDRDLCRSVAFKCVRAGGVGELREERLLREAEAAAQLAHPNIVTLHDVGRCERGPYLVFEMLRGETLEDRLARGRMPAREVIAVGVEVARGVAHAHAHGVIHRDLKPANVFLCADGRVKVLDFGLAYALGRRRVEGGTPAYMAPEQREGLPEDERTDVFALGVMLHRMRWGELPSSEHGASPAQGEGERPAWGDPPAELGALVRRMREADAAQRPRDATAVLSELVAIQGALEPAPAADRRRRAWPRLGAWAAAAGVAAVAAAVAVGVPRTRPPAAPAEAAEDGPPLSPERAHAHAVAYGYFQRGLRALAERMDFAQARTELRNALGYDASFGLARFELLILGDDPAAVAAGAASGWESRLPRPQREILRARRAGGDEARRLYRDLMTGFPEDEQLAWLAGQSAAGDGDLWGAIERYRRALAIDPAYLPALDALFSAWPAVGLWGRENELVRVAERAAAVRTDAGTLVYRAWAYALRGERQEAVEAVDLALHGEPRPSPFIAANLAAVLLDAGEGERGEALLRSWTGPEIDPATRAHAVWELGRALASQGKVREVRKLASAVRSSGAGEPASALAYALEGAAAYVGGDRKLAAASWQRALEQGVVAEDAAHPVLVASLGDLRFAESACRPADILRRLQCEATKAWKRGDRTGALAQLQDIQSRYDAPLTYLLAGEIQAELGQDSDAAGALARFLDRHDGLSFERLGALELLAQAQERMHQERDALRTVQQLLSDLSRADADLPLLAAARQTRSRLNAHEIVRR